MLSRPLVGWSIMRKAMEAAALAIATGIA